MIDEALRDRLLEMARRDRETRERLASDGTLFDGYHPEMQAVHETNAAALEAIIAAHGWPGASIAGREGAEAAWLIAQHAIALPHFQRRCLDLLRGALERGEAEAWQVAYLTDRIRLFEGKPQLYGTQFDWDEAGKMSPVPIEDPDRVDARRAAAGLEPIAKVIETHRRNAETEPRPRNLTERRRRMDAWARSVGWR